MTDGVDEVLDLPLDAHVHTDLSPDSDLPIDALAALAAARGLTELAITDHVDFERGAPAYDYTTFEQRERAVREAADRWGPHGVTIRFGVELTYDRSWESDIRDHLARHRYDFTIGSVHDRVDSPYGRAPRRRLGRRPVARRDRRAVVRRGRRGRPVRPVRRDRPHRRREALPVAARHARASSRTRPSSTSRSCEALVESGTALEVNTSGLRHPVQETYPSAAIVARFRELGGRRVTVGSDTHRATPLRRRPRRWLRARRPRPASSRWRSGAAAGWWTCPSGSPQPQAAR